MPWNLVNESVRTPSPKENLDKLMEKGINGTLRRRCKPRKRTKWVSLVDYTVEELKAHIESLFQTGMSWDNYGEWQLDHIIPKFYFFFRSSGDPIFKACWSLPNLQPLWAKEHVKKGIKAPPDYKERVSNLPYLTEANRKEIIDRIKRREEFERDLDLGGRLKEFASTVSYFAREFGIENFLVIGVDLEGQSTVFESKGIDVLFPKAFELLRRDIIRKVHFQD